MARRLRCTPSCSRNPILGCLEFVRDRRDPRGAFAPTIATALVQATGSTLSVTWHLAGMTFIGLIATLAQRSGIPLGPDHEAEQSASPIYGLSKA